MVRDEDQLSELLRGSPHPRGDGPWWGDCFFVQFEFSPPAWGWSDEPAALSETLEVLPTRVGMVL